MCPAEPHRTPMGVSTSLQTLEEPFRAEPSVEGARGDFHAGDQKPYTKPCQTLMRTCRYSAEPFAPRPALKVHAEMSRLATWLASTPALPRSAVLLSNRLFTCTLRLQSFCHTLPPFAARFSLK